VTLARFQVRAAALSRPHPHSTIIQNRSAPFITKNLQFFA
jgi:hypothetical protein